MFIVNKIMQISIHILDVICMLKGAYSQGRIVFSSVHLSVSLYDCLQTSTVSLITFVISAQYSVYICYMYSLSQAVSVDSNFKHLLTFTPPP